MPKALGRGDLPDPFTRSLYKLSPYRGCAHGCRYCDGRAEKYHVEGDFERDILARVTLPESLPAELAALREEGMIALGSGTTDAYQPCEAALRISQRAAEAIAAAPRPQPALVMTKSDLVLRDLPLWRKVNEASAFVLLVSLTSLDEELRALMEPGAPSFAARIELIRAYKEAGCVVGVLAMPLLPGLSDDEASLRRLYALCAELRVDFLLPGGLTLRPGRQKELFLRTLALAHPDRLSLYERLYAEDRPSGAPIRQASQELHARLAPLHGEYGLPWLLPFSVYRRFLPAHDALHLLLSDLGELYAARGVDVRPLREAASRYDAWLLGLRRYFRRRRSLPQTWLSERFAEALDSGELQVLLANPRLAAFLRGLLLEGHEFDYLNVRRL